MDSSAGARCLVIVTCWTLAVVSTVVDAAHITSPLPFSNLIQLTEAVLAPAWGRGGWAAIPTNISIAKERVPDFGAALPSLCLINRPTVLMAVPHTFAMFDDQFGVAYAYPINQTGAATVSSPVSVTAVAHAYLDLEKSCYVALTNASLCVALLHSIADSVSCELGGLEALQYNWTAEALQTAQAATAADFDEGEQNATLVGLSASEIFTAFVVDFLPLRSRLRHAISRSMDVMFSASEASRGLFNGSHRLTDEDEKYWFEYGTMAEWGSFLWVEYMPLLQWKWAVLYRLAISTLQPSAVAAAPISAEEEGSTKWWREMTQRASGLTRCPFVDEWPRLMTAPQMLAIDQSIDRTTTAMTNLAESIQKSRELSGVPARLLVLHHSYCTAISFLFTAALIYDAAYLQIAASLWLADPNNTNSWASQALLHGTGANVVEHAAALETAVATQLTVIQSTLSTVAEIRFIRCMSAFLNGTAPLHTSVSPSDCVEALLSSRSPASPLHPVVLHTIWNQSKAEVMNTDVDGGLARYAFTSYSASSISVSWATLHQTTPTPFGQPSLFMPFTSAPTAQVPVNSCADTAAVELQPRSTSASKDALQGDSGGGCAAGTYTDVNTAACLSCPSPCHVANTANGIESERRVVYCPGDGLMHSCPMRPFASVYAGEATGGLKSASQACIFLCENPYQAPINDSCISRIGSYYDSMSMTLQPCRISPLLPEQSAIFVGSGVTDEPDSCPFVLPHPLWTTSALSAAELMDLGLWPTPTLSEGSGLTWETMVELNGTELHEMHRISPLEGTATSLAHELVAVGTEDSHRPLAWYLISTLVQSGATTPSNIQLRLLLNTTDFFTIQDVSATTERGDADATSKEAAASPTQLLLSSPWCYGSTMVMEHCNSSSAATATRQSSDPETSTPTKTATTSLRLVFRVVLSRVTNTAAFFVNGVSIGDPIVVQWKQEVATLSSALAYHLSIGGWAATYSVQDKIAVPSTSSEYELRSWTPFAIPLHMEYIPGSIVSFSAAPAALSPAVEALRAAEIQWRTEAVVFSETLGTLVKDQGTTSLFHYTSLSPSVAYHVSQTLAARAQNESEDVFGICRPGYGIFALQLQVSCAPCPTGAYTIQQGSQRGRCACIAQRQVECITASDGSSSCLCTPRRATLAPPQYTTRPNGTVVVVDDVLQDSPEEACFLHGSIWAGWYCAPADNALTYPTVALEIDPVVVCTLGLLKGETTTTAAVSSNQLQNTSLHFLYTTGLGPDECRVLTSVQATPSSTSLSSSSSLLYYAPSQPVVSHFLFAMRASPLQAGHFSIINVSYFSPRQTAIAFSMSEYELLPLMVLNSLLHLDNLTLLQWPVVEQTLATAQLSATWACRGNSSSSSPLPEVTTLLNLTDVAPSEAFLLPVVDVSRDCRLILSVVSGAKPDDYNSFLASDTVTYTFLAVSATSAPSSSSDGDTGGHSLNETTSTMITAAFAAVSLLMAVFLYRHEHISTLQIWPS